MFGFKIIQLQSDVTTMYPHVFQKRWDVQDLFNTNPNLHNSR